MRQTTLMTLAALALAAPLAAQTATTQAQQEVAVTRQAMVASTVVQSKTTTGAPYSAETTTESVQVLADGNRIVKRTVTRVYRDTDGRTRTEMIGDNGMIEKITISDPVAGTTWTLDPQSRTATRNAVIVVSDSGWASSGGVAGGIVSAGPGSGAGGTGASVVTATVRGGKVVSSSVAGSGVVTMDGVKVRPDVSSDVNREDLGQQSIEGVMATGTRVTAIIPAGASGNEQPIRIVTENWFSPELKVLVLTKFSDPRSGETTYRLSGILRTDQPRTLFEVPADYTVQQSVIRRETR
jgi:hypothetical protein